MTKWKRQICYEEAKKCETKKEFREKNLSAYNAAQRNGWLKDYTWLERENAWTEEKCTKEARKYTKKSEFRKNSNGAYCAALKNGWMENYTWLSNERKWTYNSCRTEALKFKSGGEFSKENPSCYEIARRNGWLDDFTWLKRNNHRGHWTKKECYNEAQKCTCKSDFQAKSPVAYIKALKNGWLDEYDWFEGNTLWNYELCYEEAQKCNSRKQFRDLNPSAYHKAVKEGWIETYTWFEKRPISNKPEYIVYEYKDEETKTVYIGLTRFERLPVRDKEHRFGRLKHGTRLYDGLHEYFVSANKELPQPSIIKKDLYADDARYFEDYYVNEYKKSGWNVLNKIKAGSLGALTKWTREKCNEEAKKYTTLYDFSNTNRSCYATARRNGWLADYTWLERQCNPKNTWTYEKCYELAKDCNNSGELSKKSHAAYSAAYRNGWFADYVWFEKKIIKRKRKP